MNVQLFIPCFVDQLYPQTAFNMIKVLEKAGCTVSYNPDQTCCGQPAFNAGYWEEARNVGVKFVREFNDTDIIVAPSASCVGYVRNYFTKVFDNSSVHNEVKDLRKRMYELSEFLIDVLQVEDLGAEFNESITFHDSCAGLRECGIKAGPRQLLSKVKGLTIKEMDETETCCGFGGTFAVKFDSISAAMADQKVNHALNSGAEYIVSTDLSCLMHMQGYIDKKGLNLKTLHLADVLASGY